MCRVYANRDDMSGSGIKLEKCKKFCVERGDVCVMGERG